MALADQRSTSLDELLLAMAEGFGPVDRMAALKRLDDLGRRLFGSGTKAPVARGTAIACVLGPQLRPEAPADVEGLLLPSVLARGCGDPLALGVIYVEAARRAGFQLGLYSSPAGWLVGDRGEDCLVLIDPAGAARGQGPGGVTQLRRHCGHGIALSLLRRLAACYSARADADRTRHAKRLAQVLPVVGGGQPPGSV